MLQKVLQVSGIRTRDSAAADRCATNELNSPIKYGQNFLVNTAQWCTFWMARIYFPICGEVALKLSGKVVRWRENFRWNNVAVVRWRKDLKSGARRGGASLKSGARPALIYSRCSTNNQLIWKLVIKILSKRLNQNHIFKPKNCFYNDILKYFLFIFFIYILYYIY